jgi:signal transduction histidine kinase
LRLAPGRHWTRSLRFRLLVATLTALAVALVLAGLLLSSLFRDHVVRQFSQTLTAQLDQVTARLEFDAAGQPQIDPQTLSDPRWSRPYSGLYWQVDGADQAQQRGVLRSRSLWDATLSVPPDVLADGVVHVHEVTGPDGAALLLVERTVKWDRVGDRVGDFGGAGGGNDGSAGGAHIGADGAVGTPWRLIVAADLSETVAAALRFNGVLAASLVTLFVLLCAAALAQVAIGLAPLRELQRTLAGVHAGTSPRLDGRFPSEVQPLVDDFNAVLDRNAEVVARARTQAGNLAHAIKTPLAAMSQAAAVAQQRPETGADLAVLVEEQVGVARRHVDWHLARARAAAAQGVPGARVPVQPVIHGLVRVLERVHAQRGIALRCMPMAPDVAFAGEVQDLQEVLGNLLDNACKWARRDVQVSASALGSGPGSRLQVVIDDDGPGIASDRRASVMDRGARLDESVPGSGLGLAIVNELVGLYGGSVRLQSAPTGGLRVEVELPGA